MGFQRCATYGTVEFRRHGGTTNPVKTVSWILMCLCMVSASKQLHRKGYGSTLRGVLKAIGMFNNGALLDWAAKYLLVREKKFTSQETLQYPIFPAKDQFKRIDRNAATGGAVAAIAAIAAGLSGQYLPFTVP